MAKPTVVGRRARVPREALELLASHCHGRRERRRRRVYPGGADFARARRRGDGGAAHRPHRRRVCSAPCPKLKVVANVAVGYDNIDVAAAARRGDRGDQYARRPDRRDRRLRLGAAPGRDAQRRRGRPFRARGPVSRVDDDGVSRRASWPGVRSASPASVGSVKRSRGAAAASACTSIYAQPAPRGAGDRRRDRRASSSTRKRCWRRATCSRCTFR